jgi:P27 family predicted phage terminase small subunit
MRRDRIDPKVCLMPRATAPANLRLIAGRGNGTDSGGRKVAPVPAFKRIPPEAPDWLPDEAAAEWVRIVPELARLELLKPVDRASLTAYCLTWQRLVDAQKLIAEHQDFHYVVRSKDGEIIDSETIEGHGLLGQNSQGIVRAPWVAIAEAASKELRAWAGEFGFTPSAENKLSVREADDDEADPFS